jgi:hypothetical protein
LVLTSLLNSEVNHFLASEAISRELHLKEVNLRRKRK